MALQKQPISINFAQGIDTKTDSDQLPVDRFIALENVVFNGGALNKRNGFGLLTTLPNSEQSNLTTLNDNLIATGSNLYAYSSTTMSWLNRGTVRPVDLEVKPIVRNSAAQTVVDSAVDSNGQICVAYKEASAWYYQISDSETGQVIVARTALPANSTMARVFILGRYFVVTYLISGPNRLQFIAIPLNNPSNPGSATSISTVVSGTSAGYDGVVANDTLYVGYDASDMGGAIRVQYITSTLVVSAAVVTAGKVATLMSLTADVTQSTPIIWVSWHDSGTNDGYAKAYNQALTQVLASTQFLSSVAITELTSSAQSSLLSLFYQVTNSYSWSGRSDYIATRTLTQAGVLSSQSIPIRGVGLASKSFLQDSRIYMLAVYGGTFQPTYFLIDSLGNVVSKLAYSNGSGYAATQVLAAPSTVDGVVSIAYLFKSQLVPVNKEQGVAAVAGIYALTGINLAKFTIITPHQYSSEIASALHLTGGILWMYDTIKPVEHGFHVWPENVNVTTSTTGGSVTDQLYYYAATYEWTDSQGNLHRSAPSNPVTITAAGGNTSTNTIKVPTYRQTYKTTPNSARIVLYRWSTAQQVYYQVTSITSPTLNDPTADSVTITDTLADSSILGNVILYTTGGVIENIGAPASKHSALFKSRLFLIDAEDDNLLWYSKQVIEAVPVEMSDLLTQFVPPTTGAQGSTGGMRCLGAMDDKLIIFKQDAIYYITGNGPDNTGANNDFSEATFITGAVGCANPNSIVLTPVGLMFQSDKGIWLLGRDLSTKYIGAEVQSFNDFVIKSGLVIPGTTQVRFTLENNVILMYDYYYGQWATFTNVPGISATLYNGLHTYLNSSGQVRRETPNLYLDYTNPVLMSLTTAWIKLTGLQGFQRAYYMYLLSNYLTPHKLNVEIAYDYDSNTTQNVLISPTNFSPNWGDLALWGSGDAWGGPSSVEQWRVFFNKQKCEAIQLSISEQYDSTKGAPAGAGLTFSGISVLIGAKNSHPMLKPSNSAG